MTKTLSKAGIKGNFPSLIKSIYKKPTVHVLSDEGLNAFSLRMRARQGYLLSPVLFDTVLEVPASTILRKEIQGIRIGKEEENGPFEDDMILHVEHLKNPQNNTGANKWICPTIMPNWFLTKAQASRWRKYSLFSIWWWS